MIHNEIRRAAHDAAYAAFLTCADHDERRTQQSIEDFDAAKDAHSGPLYEYCRDRVFPKPEVLWRKMHEFEETPVERDWTRISESERVYFTVFGATAAALEPFHEPDPEPTDANDGRELEAQGEAYDGAGEQAGEGAPAEAPAEEPGADGSGEVAESGEAPTAEGDPANAGDVTEPPVDHSSVSGEADQESVVVPPVDHSAATPEAEAAEAEAAATSNDEVDDAVSDRDEADLGPGADGTRGDDRTGGEAGSYAGEDPGGSDAGEMDADRAAHADPEATAGSPSEGDLGAVDGHDRLALEGSEAAELPEKPAKKSRSRK